MTEQTYDEYRQVENEKTRILLENIGKKLAGLGFTINWSADESEPSLIVNGICLLRKGYQSEKDGVSAKFWYQEDLLLKGDLMDILQDQINFADYCFTIGGPALGMSLK